MTYNLLSNLQKYEVLNKNTTVDLFKAYKEGNRKAREKLILHNLRLVVHIQKKYDSKLKNEDLTQVGIIGLIKAVESFNIEKEILFATFASSCIENEMRMFYRQNHKHEQVTSLNQPVLHITDDDNSHTYEDLFMDPLQNIEEIIDDNITSTIIQDSVNSLPIKAKNIIKLFYGIENDKRYTQKEIAELLGYSQSYISRIIKSANHDIKRKILKNGY